MAKINSTIFKQETIKSWFSGVGTSVNNEVIQPFQNANSVISKYNLAIQHNSLTQQGWQRLLAQSDDSLKAYLTSIKGSTASMAGYNVSLQGSITGFTKVSNAIKQYNALGAVSLKEQQAFATVVGATNAKLGSYLIGLNGSTAGLRGYGVSLVASTAKTIGLTVATTALNAAMTMGISVIVTGLISAFTAWINKSEEITEKAQEAADKINSISESLKTNTETVENAKRRYAELAQEVENLGKITQSQGTLSNGEYEEFLDLSNQLAGIFPSLTKNYDENGNAILDLSGDVNTIVSSLDDLIQKEKELANQQIMEEFPDVFKGYAQDVSDAEQKVKSAQIAFDKINNAYQQLATHGTSSLAFDTTQTGEPFATFKNEIGEDVTIGINEYTQALDELGIAYKKSNIWKPNQFGGKDLVGTLVEATGDIDTAFTSKLETARENLQYAQQQLEGEKSSIDSYLNTWLQGEFSYVQIDDSGLQTAIQDMLFNFDFSNIPENKRGDWNYVSEYLRRNILFEINKVQDNPVISKAISEVFTNAELTPDEKANYLQQIQDFFGEDSAIVISLKPQIEETNTLQKQLNAAIEKAQKQESDFDWDSWFKENSINTQKEIDKWNEIAESATNAADARKKYTEGEEVDGSFTDPSDLLKESDNKETTATLADLQEEADLLSTIKKELDESGNIGVSSMQSIIKQYPEAKEALADYMSGVISEQELFAELEKVYENDTDQYIKSLVAKNEKDEEFFNAVKTNNETLFNELGTVYGYDVDNWKNMAQAKADIDAQLIKQLSGKWAKYFNIIADASTGMLSMGFDDSELALVNPAEAEKLNKQYEETKEWAQQLVDSAHKAYSELENAAYDQIKIGIDTSWESLSGYDSDKKSKESNSKTYDLIERKIEKLNRVINNLENTVDDTFSTWSERNSALADEIDSVTEKIGLQEHAYNKYMELADSVGLDDYYKDLIKNGAIDVIEISDENLQKQIDAFQDYYDKAMKCDDSVRELQSDLNKLSTVKFDNISKQFEELTESISHAINMINKYIELAEEKNNFVPKEAYEKLLAEQQKNTADLIEERNKLNKEYSNLIAQGLKEDSEECKKLKQEIDGVTESIIDSMIAEEKWKNSIQNSDFEVFDWIQDKVSNITSEADFYINYIEGSGKDLVDENGNLTDEGITVAGLHAQNINTYLQQADDYAKKIEEVNKLLSDDPTNQALVEQKKKYIDAQREAIISTQEERKAIIDLVKDGYDKQVEALGNLIDEYKDLMSVSKDAHDYEKSMSEKTATLASLQKQYLAWQRDDSEAGMKNRQELEKQIKDAKDDIEETQYEKMISDAERLLDDLKAEYEALVNENVDRICKDLGNITDAVNENASTIKTVLGEISKDTEIPLTAAMKNIWNNGKPVGDINGTVATVNNSVSGTTQAINGLKGELKTLFQQMEENFNNDVKDTDDGSYDPNNTPDTTPDNSNPYEPSYEPSNNSDDSDKAENSSIDSWAIYKYYFPQELDTDHSVVDRLKSNNIDAGFEARSQYWDKLIGDGKYYGATEQNIRLLDWLKEHGYANGTNYATKGLHLTDEEGLGSEVIITKHGALRQLDSGDHVFSSEASKRLYELSQNPAEYMEKLGLQNSLPQLNISIPKLPEMVNKNTYTNAKVEFGDVSLNFPNVQNYEDFMKQAQRDTRFEKMVQEMTFGQALGRNSLNKLKF